VFFNIYMQYFGLNMLISIIGRDQSEKATGAH
jgi:hypothetical protein